MNLKILKLIVGASLLLVFAVWLIPKSSRLPNPPADFEANKIKEKRTVAASNTQITKGQNDLEEDLASSYWVEDQISNRLKVADVDIPLVFEGELEDELKKVIVTDLTAIFGHFTGHSFFQPKSEYRFEIQGIEKSSSRGIQFDGEGAFWPSALNGKLISWNGEGLESIVISAEIISAYREAWDLRNANGKIFRELVEFLEQVNRASKDEPIDRNPEDLLWTPQKNINRPSEISNVVQNFSNSSLMRPSLLEIQGRQTPDNSDYPIFGAKTYFLKEGTDIPSVVVPLAYHDNRWKFVYGQPGT